MRHITFKFVIFSAALLSLSTVQAMALDLATCTRTTHISHGGEADHRDMAEGRVMWREWWSQEGTATTLHVMECGSGETLSFRTAEENMSARNPFNRTDKALKIVNDHHIGSRVFATLPRLADALEKTARDITLVTAEDETCACAALYPDLRGNKTEFALGG